MYTSYSGSIDPIIDHFDRRMVKCSINETFFIKNPFKSIHACFGNLGELTSGLLMVIIYKTLIKEGIITQIDIKYHKKARGVIQAISNIESLKNGAIKADYDQDKFLNRSVM